MQNENKKLNSGYVTGFCDGESSFVVVIQKNPKLRAGWECRAWFSIGLDIKDKMLAKRLQSFFGVGKIYESTKVVTYRVSSLKEIRDVIIPHFLANPLITQKQIDFLLFKSIIDLMSSKDHLHFEGVQKIVDIRASMNLGLSDELKDSFPNTIPGARPAVEFKGIPGPQ
jgi:hypothetical protein